MKNLIPKILESYDISPDPNFTWVSIGTRSLESGEMSSDPWNQVTFHPIPKEDEPTVKVKLFLANVRYYVSPIVLTSQCIKINVLLVERESYALFWQTIEGERLSFQMVAISCFLLWHWIKFFLFQQQTNVIRFSLFSKSNLNSHNALGHFH